MDSRPPFSPQVAPLSPATDSPSDLHHVVIVGGGFGGVKAARALAGKPVRVTLIDKRNVHLFQPLLYQVATASLSPAEISFPIRSMFTRYPNVRVLLAEATGIDLERRVVTLDRGELPYDSLILAAGVRPGYFGHDAWQSFAPGLKSIEDAETIRDQVLQAFELAEREPDPVRRRELLTFVVVGGGPTGVEMAGAIGELAHQTLRREYRNIDPRCARIVLVDGGPHILKGYPDRLVRSATASLKRLGVEVLTDTPVTAVESGLVTLGDVRIATRNVIWAAGVEAPPITKTLGVPLAYGDRVAVNPDLTIPGFPEAMAIGDVAALAGKDGQPLPGVCQVAMQEGVLAGKNILRQLQGKPMRAFHYRDKGMIATIGRNRAVADIGPMHLSGFPAWAIWALIHIVSLIGQRSRLTVMLQWMWSYVTRGRGARIIREAGEVRSSDRPTPLVAADPIAYRSPVPRRTEVAPVMQAAGRH
ncbi:MAG: NAD(P)/FAD-dependent oxidoreductase [Thermomicrobiales bacterium]